MKIFVCTTCRPNIKKKKIEAGKVATLVKVLNVGKPWYGMLFKIWRSNFCNQHFTHTAAVDAGQKSQFFKYL